MAAYGAYQSAYKNCASSTTVLDDFKECFSAKKHPDAGEYRSQQDLNAQREMAYWAKAMLQATLASVFVTAVGVAYVALTLRETRRTTAAATAGTRAAQVAADQALDTNRIMREEQRPWLIVSPLVKFSSMIPVLNYTRNGVKISDTHYCFQPKIPVDIINTGNTPARDVKVYMDLIHRFKLDRDIRHIPEHGRQGRADSDGIMYWDVGLYEFFKEKNAENIDRISNITSFTIGQNHRYIEPFRHIENVQIRKEIDNFKSSQSLAITISYRGPHSDKLFESQFAFDLCGRVGSALDIYPPSGPAYEEGKYLFFRPAESSIK